jgi:imidazolonepropionase-like amidohydrolase
VPVRSCKVWSFIVVVSLVASFACAQTGQTRAVEPRADKGQFLLFTIGARCGEETYDVTRGQDGSILHSNLQCGDWNGKTMLDTTLRLKPDLTPIELEMKGKTPGDIAEPEKDTEIQVNAQGAWLRFGRSSQRVSAPHTFFTVTLYAPVTVRLMLVRYWAAHGSPKVLPILPEGQITIERHGADTIRANGKVVQLSAFSIQGLGWGREWLWLDMQQRLVALVTHKVGNDGITEESFEAVRPSYEAALPAFASRAARYSEAELERAARPFSSQPAALAIVGSTLIDGTGGPPLADSTVVVQGGKIVAAGLHSGVEVPPAAQVIDARGKFLLPGLWDMHTHAFLPDYGAACLAGGVTTARDCDNEYALIEAMRDSIREGRGLGPRFLLAGGTQDEAPGTWAFELPVRTPEQARAVVSRFKAAGYEQVKIFESIKPSILRILATDAHQAGMTLTGHIPNGLDARQAAAAGMDGIEHIMYLNSVMSGYRPISPAEPKTDDPFLGMLLTTPDVDPASPAVAEAVRFFRKQGTVIDPTMVAWERSWHDRTVPLSQVIPGADKAPPELVRPQVALGLPPDQAKLFQAAFARELKVIEALHRGGVTLVTGTDARIPAYELYRELELFVRAGFTPMEAIQAATIVPARAMRLDGGVGTVEPGKRADLILLDRNPLEDISNIRTVKTVILHGRIYDCSRLWKVAGFSQ